MLNVTALSPQQCARSQSSRHGQWNRTWSGQANRPSLKNAWSSLCNKAMIMVSDDRYARPRDPCLSETTRTKHSRHHLTSNFNIFECKSCTQTKSKRPYKCNSCAEQYIWEWFLSVLWWSLQLYDCTEEAATCLLHLENIQLSINAFPSSVARWIYSFCASVCVCGRICMCVCKWCVKSLRIQMKNT